MPKQDGGPGGDVIDSILMGVGRGSALVVNPAAAIHEAPVEPVGQGKKDQGNKEYQYHALGRWLMAFFG